MERAQRSDPDAWAQLYVGAYGRLLAYARRRLPRGEEADDAVSETFARAYEHIGRFRWRGGGFDAWLFGILRNVVLETARHRVTVPMAPGREQATTEPGPLEHVLADEEERQVRAAFDRLSPEDRDVLELRVIGGLDAAGVAAVLGKRPGAVRMSQSRALGRLRALMEESESDG